MSMIKPLTSTLLVLSLAACGGGGGDSDTFSWDTMTVTDGSTVTSVSMVSDATLDTANPTAYQVDIDSASGSATTALFSFSFDPTNSNQLTSLYVMVGTAEYNCGNATDCAPTGATVTVDAANRVIRVQGLTLPGINSTTGTTVIDSRLRWVL